MATLSSLDQDLAEGFHDLDRSRRDEPAPTRKQKITWFTVACLILNRTIGSGIFVAPRNVLLGTGSVGVAIILWALGGLIMFCGLVCWNEFGLTIPQRIVPGGETRAVPRSGGEKNYLEYLLQRPRFLATCLFGIAFLVLGNLAGNAIAFGTYVLQAAGVDPIQHRNWNIAIAVGASTASCLIHVFSRRGGILLSNLFAVIKVSMLLAIFILGIVVGAGGRIGSNHSQSYSEASSISPSKAFAHHSTSVSDVAYSIFYILYAYSGFEQPFYVLSEARSPRKVFPRTTFFTMLFAVTLFVLVNIAYVCVVPTDTDALQNSPDMATLFFRTIFGSSMAPRAISAIIAVCIAGNIIVMTFTAARVKQEIAKEGILPFSLFFASGNVTPDAWLLGKRSQTQLSSKDPTLRAAQQLVNPERTPIPALLLHWIMSILLIAVTASLSAATAYGALVFLYSFVLIAMVGLCVSVGLVSLYLTPAARWHKPGGPQGFRPWGGPAAAIVYAVAMAFILAASFVPPAVTSPYGYAATHIQWYILPAIGLSAVLWGLVWWLGLHAVERRRAKRLVVTRVPHIEWDGAEGSGDGAWIQTSEVIVHHWMNPQYVRSADGAARPGWEPVQSAVSAWEPVHSAQEYTAYDGYRPDADVSAQTPLQPAKFPMSAVSYHHPYE